MVIAPVLHLARVFLRMFLRDRQAMFFSLFFPILFLTIFGYVRDRPIDRIEISVASKATGAAATEFLQLLGDNVLFSIQQGEEAQLRDQLMAGETTLVLVIPSTFDASTRETELTVVVDASQVRLLSLIMPALREALLDVERSLRQTEPMFTLKMEDVQSRSQRYIDFLFPGILAFSLMQISIAGSGFNIVEYRRKGILRRLFVTPIRPSEFIAALCIARLGWVLIQMTILLAYGLFILDINLVGNVASLYFLVVLGTVIFLCLGFCIGSLSKTQQVVGAIGSLVIFPQVFLSGVFFPISAMPDMVQPVAHLLPLSFLVSSMREVATNGLGLHEILPGLAGIGVWIGITFLAATRLFVWKEVVN